MMIKNTGDYAEQKTNKCMLSNGILLDLDHICKFIL